MLPTENYATFKLAKELSKTVSELLVGQPQPLSTLEQYLWNRWRLADARLRQQATKPGKRFS